MKIVERWESGVVGESDQTAYFETGTTFELQTGGRSVPYRSTRVDRLPAVEIPIHLKERDTLILTKDLEFGRPARRNVDAEVMEPARVSCTLPEMLDDVRAGEAVKLNDGKIEGVIAAVRDGEISIEITHAGDEGRNLRAERSINFPDSKLRLMGMTDKDRSDLDLIISCADIVGLSFASRPEDVIHLQEELAKHEASSGRRRFSKGWRRVVFRRAPKSLTPPWPNAPGVLCSKKGPYILKAMHTLEDVLRRMQGHQRKKTALLRGLNVSNALISARTNS